MTVEQGTPADPQELAPELAPARHFDEACRQVVTHLAAVAPMGLWAVTRVTHGQQVMLVTAGPGYGLGPGAEVPFAASPCHVMVTDPDAPHVAADLAAEPAYADVPLARQVELGAYVGTPICWPDGTLFGTVCGFDPEPLTVGVAGLEPLLELVSGLLAAVLRSDVAATELAREVERVRGEAETDELTGLLNRRGWDRFLRTEEDRFRRFGDPACIVVLDLDQLKAVNDSLGHAAGDDYIRRAAHALAGAVRGGDVLARLGGDEFGVVAVGADAAEAHELVDRLAAALGHAQVAGSFGVAPWTVVAGFPGAWQAADDAMYEQKRARRALRS